MIPNIILFFFSQFFFSILVPGLYISYLLWEKSLFNKFAFSLFFIRIITIGIIYNYLLLIISITFFSLFGLSLKYLYLFRITDLIILIFLLLNIKNIIFSFKGKFKKTFNFIDLIIVAISILLGIVSILNAPQAIAGDQLYWTNNFIIKSTLFDFSYFSQLSFAGELGYSSLLVSPYVFIGHLHLFAVASGYKIILFLLVALMSIYFTECLFVNRKSIDLSIYKVLCFLIISCSFIGTYGICQTAKPTTFGVLFSAMFFLSLIPLIKTQKKELMIDSLLLLTCAISFATISIPYITLFALLFFISKSSMQKSFFLYFFIVLLFNFSLVIFSLASNGFAVVIFSLCIMLFIFYYYYFEKLNKNWQIIENKFLYISFTLFFLIFFLFNNSNLINELLGNMNLTDLIINNSGVPYAFTAISLISILYLSVFMKRSIEKTFFICLILSLTIIIFFIVLYYLVASWGIIKNINHIFGNNGISVLQLFISQVRWYLPIVICFLIINLLNSIFINMSTRNKIIIFLILVTIIIQNNIINIRELWHVAHTNSICGHKNSDIADFTELLFKFPDPLKQLIFIKPKENTATNDYNIKLLDYFCYVDKKNKNAIKKYQNNYGLCIANSKLNNDKVIFHYLNYINYSNDIRPTYNVYEYTNPLLGKKIRESSPALLVIDGSNLNLINNIKTNYSFNKFQLVKHFKSTNNYVFFIK